MALKESNKNRKKKIVPAPVVEQPKAVIPRQRSNTEYFLIGAVLGLIVFLLI